MAERSAEGQAAVDPVACPASFGLRVSVSCSRLFCLRLKGSEGQSILCSLKVI